MQSAKRRQASEVLYGPECLKESIYKIAGAMDFLGDECWARFENKVHMGNIHMLCEKKV